MEVSVGVVIDSRFVSLSQLANEIAMKGDFCPQSLLAMNPA
ncbi:MAG TPA: hypothetical protein VGR47_13015 [Terracidiphilus sp.]|nr:hypothetical protein [Terracidiphilus sp.]